MTECEVKKVYERLNNIKKVKKKQLSNYLGYYLFGILNVPGKKYLKKILDKLKDLYEKEIITVQTYENLTMCPLDSVRYYEFDNVFKFIRKTKAKKYLDLSSPRFIPYFVSEKLHNAEIKLINPDINDLNITKYLFSENINDNSIEFLNCLSSEISFQNEYFDLITSISVIEHMPADGDIQTIQKLWSLLKPGGKLILTTPCCKEMYEEYLDVNEYELYKEDSNGFVFGQKVYDEKYLQKNIFSIIGNPKNYRIFGEKIKGSFNKNRLKKLSMDYAFWQEIFMVFTEYKYYKRIQDLPGLGVIAMEFIKPV